MSDTTRTRKSKFIKIFPVSFYKYGSSKCKQEVCLHHGLYDICKNFCLFRPAKSKSTGAAIIAGKRNSQDASRNKRRPSEATVRTSNIAKLDKISEAAAKTTNRRSSISVKAEKTDSSSQQEKKSNSRRSSQDVKAKSTRDAHPKSTKDNQATNEMNKAKTLKDNHAKSTQDIYAKSTRDNHAKSTQNADLKTTASSTSKTVDPDGKEDSIKTGQVAHVEASGQAPKAAANLTGLTLKELKAKSNSGKDTKNTPSAASRKDSPTDSESLPDQSEAISLPGSISPTKLSPSLTPENSLSPTGKPQAMIGAQINSPDLEDLTRDRFRSSHAVLTVTESEKDLYIRELNLRKMEDFQDDEPADKDLGDDSGKKRKIDSGTKPKVPKAKKKLLRSKPKDDDDGAKATDGGAKITDGAAKSTDDGVKITDGEAKITDSGAKTTDGGAKITDSGAKIPDSKVKVCITYINLMTTGCYGYLLTCSP